MEPITQSDKLTLGNLLNRFTSPTPAFQASLRNFWLKICSVSIIVLAVNQSEPGIVPAIIVTLAKIAGVISATGAFHAQTTKVTSPDQVTNTADTDDTTTS